MARRSALTSFTRVIHRSDRGDLEAFFLSLFIYWRLIVQSTAQGHLSNLPFVLTYFLVAVFAIFLSPGIEKRQTEMVNGTSIS